MGCQLLTYSSIRTSDVRNFLEFTDGRRKLPLKSVLLTFDGGHGAFCSMPPMFKEPSERDHGMQMSRAASHRVNDDGSRQDRHGLLVAESPAQVHVRIPALGGST